MRCRIHRLIGLGALLLFSARAFAAMEETLRYELVWGLIRVGTAEVTTRLVEEEGRPLLRFRFTAKSNRWVEKIYPVEDCIDSFIEPETGLPVKLVKKTSEGWFRCDDELRFDRERGVAAWVDHVRGTNTEYAVAPGAHDFFSLMRGMRELDLRPGREDRATIAADDRTHNLVIRVEREEHLALRGARVRAYRLRITSEQEGLFVRKVPGAVWITAEPPHTVAQMQVRVPVGSVRAVLLDESK
ncbi:MAG: DUF3108 domain-containing protein [Kiritimatiellae bacterium]|nr:DUF3108 domain-containing protein [Kiritimatiellia bacterium]